MIPAFMLPMLIGGGLGALKSKDPLKGALMGAGMGALGGAAAPALGGLLGQAGTAASLGTSLGSEQTAMLAAQEAGMGGGLMGTLQDMAPMANAAATGIQTVQGMMPQEQPIAPPQLPQQNGGGILAQLAQMPQAQNMSEQQRMMRRQQRRGLLS